ncbi:RNA polymerase sigma factor [Streptomyces sp. NPDC091972]|uniref:RNA polymerase sigma factor n=1 Tax=Streptomyces sp. NPDC091972 TaxID=3366007 RepID=UPI00382734AD
MQPPPNPSPQPPEPQVEEFEEFFRAWFPRLVAIMVRRGYSLEDAKDSATDAMISLLQNWEKVSHKVAWVTLTANRLALRSAMRQSKVSDLYRRADSGENVALSADQILLPADLLKQIREILPPKQREIFYFSMEGYSSKEISELTGSSPATVRSQLRHAREKIIKELDLD